MTRQLASLGILIFLSSASMAITPNELNCPSPSSKVDFTSPLSKQRRVFCQLDVGGKLVPHGPEWIFDAQGTLLSQSTYDKGQLVMATPTPTSTPRESSLAFAEILRSIIPEMNRNNASTFKTHGCKSDQSKWIQLAIMKTRFTEHLAFSPGCDVEGPLSPDIGNPFPLQLKIRNLGNFTSVRMNLQIDISKAEVGFRYMVTCLDGRLNSEKGSTQFKGNYSVTINPLVKRGIEKNEGGSITLLNVDGKAVNETEAIMVN